MGAESHATPSPEPAGGVEMSKPSSVRPSPMPEGGGEGEAAPAHAVVFRKLVLNGGEENEARIRAGGWRDNSVSTARYSLLSFLPKNLLEFFRIVANMYFLVISILQVATTLSPTNPYTTITPLTVVFIITMVKNGIEDWKRHQADAEMNARPTRRLRAGLASDVHRREFVGVPWREVCVGDVLLVRDREEVPADIIVLASSEEEGRCFIETSNLDGETNLKRRESLRATAQRVAWREAGAPPSDEVDAGRAARALVGEVEVEPPSDSLETFVGTVHLGESPGGLPGASADLSGPVPAEDAPVNPVNVIFRGCQVRSCAWVLGVVIYTGADTRLMQNQRAAPSKQSNVYRQVNRYISVIFITQFILCVVSAIAYGIWSVAAAEGSAAWYLGEVLASAGPGDATASFFTFLILYNNLVPISLYVSLDVIKVSQAKLIEADPAMCLVKAAEDGGAAGAGDGDASPGKEGSDAIDPLVSSGPGRTDSVPPTPRSAPHPAVVRKWAKARTSDLNEDLGQIEYIFSDKTGTLTQNSMEFRKCSIGGFAYGFGTTEIGRAAMARAQAAGGDAGAVAGVGIPGILPPQDADRLSDADRAQYLRDAGIGFDDPRLLAHLGGLLTEAEAAGEAPAAVPPPPEGDQRWGKTAEAAGGAAGGGGGGGGGGVPLAVEQARRIRAFLTVLSVCHTVIPERDARTGKVAYRASSPDEEALVRAAKCLGFDLMRAAPRTAVAVGGDETLEVEVVGVNEFNSDRKRMSVVVRFPDGGGAVYCKGADSIMTPLVGDWGPSPPHAGDRSPKDLMLDHLRVFAGEGLRTLVLAEKMLSSEQVDDWERQYKAAAAALEGRGDKLAAVAASIERDLTIVGATAIEDKLQDGVPEAIATLARANIKIWVLTGDKEETAINIGFACRLLDDGMSLVKVLGDDPAAIAAQLDRLVNGRDSPIAPLVRARELLEGTTPPPPPPVSSSPTSAGEDGGGDAGAGAGAGAAVAAGGKAPRIALIVDGAALSCVFPTPKDKDKRQAVQSPLTPMQRDLLRVARECRAVVACRVSPKQKASVVQLVRVGVKPQPVTLAIGDGANDVNMIQTAHVGVGISGNEGVQAVNSSDYAIAQFRYLRPLLLVHGRLNYQRISHTILYSFYKNVALVSVLFLYQFYTGFSGTTLFESFVQAGWNFFTAFPIIAIGVGDHDVPAHMASRFPGLYAEGPANKSLNLGLFASWLVMGLYHALLVFFLSLPIVLAQPWATTGEPDGLFMVGLAVYTFLLLAMQIRVMLLARAWTRLFVITLDISLAMFLLFCGIYGAIAVQLSPDFAFVPFVLASRPAFWFGLLLLPTAALLVNVAGPAVAWLVDGPGLADAMAVVLFTPGTTCYAGEQEGDKQRAVDELPDDFFMPGDTLADLLVRGPAVTDPDGANPDAGGPSLADQVPDKPKHGETTPTAKPSKALGMTNSNAHTGFDFSFVDTRHDA